MGTATGSKSKNTTDDIGEFVNWVCEEIDFRKKIGYDSIVLSGTTDKSNGRGEVNYTFISTLVSKMSGARPRSYVSRGHYSYGTPDEDIPTPEQYSVNNLIIIRDKVRINPKYADVRFSLPGSRLELSF